jgi:hypothetical protein
MRCLVPLFLVLCAGARAQLTVPPPDDLMDAGHCIAATHQDWFGLAQHPLDLDLGYVTDAKAWQGDDVVYIVNYTTPTHSEGLVDIVLVHGKEAHRVIQVQFSTAFRQSDDGSKQVQLVNPPLGGIGTQDQIVAAIHQVGFHTWTVPVADLQSHSSAAQCESIPARE